MSFIHPLFKKVYKFLLYTFLLLNTCFVFSQTKLKIGIDNNYPPYEFINSNGQPDGFNVELISKILDEYGYQYEFVARPWDQIYTSFKNKEIDVLSLLFSDKRNTYFILSTPHNIITYSAFYNKNIKKEINAIAQTSDLVLIKDDIMHEYFVNEKYVSVTTVPNAEKAFEIIKKDNAKIAVLPKLQGIQIISKHAYKSIDFSSKLYFNQKYCFAVNVEQKELIFFLNEGLSIVKEKEIYDELYQKWFLDLEKKELSLIRFLKINMPYLVGLLLIMGVIILWNFMLKRAVNARNKDLKEELMARERTEMAIIESEERFRSLTENSPSSIFIFTNEKILFVNNAACKITAHSKEDLLKMSFFELLVNEKDKEVLKIFSDKTKRDKSESSSFDIKISNKKGSHIWLNFTALNSYYKAEPVIIGSAFDITDRQDFLLEISESKRMYNTLIDNIQGMVYRCSNDKNWTMSFISEGCNALTGYHAHEMVNNNIISYNDIIHKDDQHYVWSTIQNNIKQNIPYTIEYRIITKTNDVKWVWEQGRFVESYGEMLLEGYIIDITESINNKKELIKERKRYQTMLQSIGDGVISTDINGNITMLNRVAEQLTGWTEADAIGKPLEMVFNIVNETTGEKCVNPVQKVLETGAIVGLANHTILISKTERQYVISDSAAPIRDDKGNISGVILVFSDNTENKLAQDAIILSEKKLKAIINAIPDLIFRNTKDGVYTYFHVGSNQALLLDSSKIVGANIKDVFDEMFSSKILNAFAECIDTGEPKNIEYFINTPEGIFYYDAKIVKYNDNEILALCRDITEQKKAQDIIYKSEENYRKLFELANDPIFIIKNNVFVNCNKRTIDVFGYQEEEIVGKTPDLLSPEFQNDGTTSKEKAIHYINKALNEEQACFEWEHQRKDGSAFTTEISLTKIVLQNEVSLLAIVRDISQRKLYEKALEESEDKYKTLVEKANDGITIIQDNNFIYANKKLCEFTGYTFDEIINKPFLSFIDKGFHELVIKYNKARIIKEESIPNIYEIEAFHKSGKRLYVELNSNYINYNDKPAVIVVVRDISERKEAQENLRLFKATIENSTDAVGMCTPQGVHYYQNEAFDRLFGNLCENDIASVYKDATTKDEVFNTIMSGNHFIKEIEMFSKDGELLNVLLRAYPNYDVNGNITSLVGIHTDVTQRKQTELALQKSEEKFRMLLELAVDAFLQGDANGNIIMVNNQTINLTGYSKEELLQLNIAALFDPESLTKKPLLYRNLELGQVLKNERVIIAKNGEKIHIEMNSRKMPDGTYQSFFRDITERKITEQKLITSEEKYRHIVDFTPDGIIIHVQGKIVFANKAAFKLIEAQNQDDLINKNAIDFVHPESREIALNRIKKIYETKQVESFIEEKLITLNNKVLDVEVIGIPVDYMGEFGIQTIIRDISERKEVLKALMESEEKYRNLFENITQGFSLHDIILNEKGEPIDYRFIAVNPAFELLTGLKSQNIIGRCVKEVMPNTEDYWIKTFGEVAITGKHMYYENYASDLEKYYETWVYSPQKGKFAVIFSDITERKITEETLKTLLAVSQMSDRKIQEITDYTLEKTVFLTNCDIAFLAFTAEDLKSIHLHSFSKEVFINDNVSYSLDLKLEENSLFKKAIDSKKAIIIDDYKSMNSDKKLPDWHVAIQNVLIVPIIDDSQVVALIAAANKKKGFSEYDIQQISLLFDRLWKIIQTKKFNESIQRLNTELIEKNKEMEQFVYVTSHDLRSPLVNIQGFAKELNSNCADMRTLLQDNEIENADLKKNILQIFDNDVDEALKYIDLSVRKMDTLLNGLLRLSRMGRVVPNMKKVNMNSIIKDILNSLEFQIMKKNIKVEVSVLHDCMADEVLINQVFSNLIDNAIKYNDKENGVIQITSTFQNEKVIYSVHDNGPGINPKYHKKIFEIFQRLNSTVIGEGLGLSIVQKIIEKHNGKIWLESEENKFTTFFIEL